MKVIFLFFTYFAITIQTVFGQSVKSIPTEEEWQTYFYSRKKSIEMKLYQLALEGKIRAFKTDLLIDCYSPEQFKKKGSYDTTKTDYDSNVFFDAENKMLLRKSDKGISRRKEARLKLRKDSIIYLPFDPNKSLKDLWFLKSIKSSPFDEEVHSSFQGLALTFQPTFQGYGMSYVSLCWFSTEDLKKVLGKAEFEWLKLIYYYTSNDNTILFRTFEHSYDDIYYDINNIKSSHIIYSCDTLLFRKISNSVGFGGFNFNEYFRGKKAGISQLPILYDYQQKRNISYNDFQNKYYDELTSFISTDPNNPDIGRDTITRGLKEIYGPDSIVIDTNSFRILKFVFNVRQSYPLYGYDQFSMEADRIRKLNTIPTIFWFFEDYFRWKK